MKNETLRKQESKIKAIKARQDVLDECGIRWAWYEEDGDFYFRFKTKADEEAAIKALKAALEL